MVQVTFEGRGRGIEGKKFEENKLNYLFKLLLLGGSCCGAAQQGKSFFYGLPK